MRRILSWGRQVGSRPRPDCPYSKPLNRKGLHDQGIGVEAVDRGKVQGRDRLKEKAGGGNGGAGVGHGAFAAGRALLWQSSLAGEGGPANPPRGFGPQICQSGGFQYHANSPQLTNYLGDPCAHVV